ncbi:nucleotidyltransferase family protein [Noviherbaspirillum sedimenti]|uniref:Nucleotidyltransferase family protein n=1 Tax=Noviherbaspirillum sedimenti TaxID=2320865 RepID=A0A3A3FZ36_9BURK|nr:nucleotidyltransferase family protein [Noviherbaspirillum sedimenti]RJG01423.1 nucleotidyltransferase family protein [Noviherbaspirillum sedimenti]
MDQAPTQGYAGILLAAGRGARFDPSGHQNKLLQLLSDGETVVAHAARNLRSALGSALAVIPADSPLLCAHLSSEGFAVTKCVNAASGMAASLTHGLRLTPHAAGWVIALGDMPFIQADTMTRLVEALRQGADIAVPCYRGRRGNPVAFSRRHLDLLLQLSGDIGARQLLQSLPVMEITVDDPGVCRDIDTVADLRNCRCSKETVHA